MYPSMENLQSVKLILCLLLLTNFIHFSLAAVDDEKTKTNIPELPLIWGEKSTGRDKSEQSYRLAGDIQLANSDKWYLFEEWASLTQKKFRFDLTEAPTSKRRTLLAYAETGENFVYQPFTCSLVENLNAELFEGLKNKFPPSQKDQLISTGIGSIWTYAKQHEQKYVAPYCDKCENDHKSRRFSKHLEDMRRYTVEPTADYSYRVDFYFRPDKFQNEPKTLVLIRLTDLSGKVVMLIRMLGYEPIPQVEPDKRMTEGEIYDLPLGYGCQRRARYEDAFAVPVNILANQEQPQVLRLDIVSLQPQNEGDDMEKWRSHLMSVKMVSGRLSLDVENRDYLVLEIQEYAPEAGATSSSMDGAKTNRATMRRLRRVWDLGANGLTGEQDGMAVYFEIDERKAKCLGLGEVEVKQAARIQFPVGSNQKEGKQQYKVPGLILNNEFLKLIFDSTDDFHLIRESSQGRRKEFIYERRQLDFRLRDERGKELWCGPVSLIKRQSMYVNDFERDKKQSSVDVSSSSVTIQFLSKDLEKFVSKITITLAGKEPISVAALHREMNIATLCYGRESSLGEATNQQPPWLGRWNHERREKEWTNLEISLTYPVECDASRAVDAAGAAGAADDDESTTRPPSSLIAACSCDSLKRFLAGGRLAEPVIYEQFLSSLFRTMRGRLDPMQLSQVGVLMSPQLDAVRVGAKLVARPALLAFSEAPGRRFARARRPGHIHAELKPSKFACAEACQHLNCPVFVYCPLSNECDLSMSDDDDSDDSHEHLLYEPDASCSVFKVAKGRRADIASPQEVANELRRLAEEEPAHLELNLRELDEAGNLVNEFRLRPQRVESGKVGSDLFDDAETHGEADSVGEEDSENLVQVEYEIVALNRNFEPNKRSSPRRDFPLELAKQVSYQDCEALCQEIDCQSFSYCQLEQTCQVSQLRKGADIMDASESEDFCHIFGRDYLSKFTRSLRLESGKLLVGLARSFGAANAHDCAQHCLEEADFKCRSFYACSEMAPPGDKQRQAVDCHLRRSHLSGAAGEIRSDSEQVEHSAALWPGVACHLYTRSYLAEFDRFQGRALGSGEGQAVVLRNTGAEGCGLACAERRGRCWAFQVCRARLGPICALSLAAEREANQWAPPGAKPAPGDRLVANERCTTFVVSAGSELASLRVRDELPAERSQRPAASRAAWIVVFLAGLALGLVAGHLRRRRQ